MQEEAWVGYQKDLIRENKWVVESPPWRCLRCVDVAFRDVV